MKPVHWIILSIAVLAALYLNWPGDGTPSPASLARKALTAPELNDRVTAVVALSMYKDPVPAIQLRQLASESRDARVVVQAVGTLAQRFDPESLPQFFAAMEHDSEQVREAGYIGVLNAMSLTPEQGFNFQAGDPPDKRKQALRSLHELHEKLSGASQSTKGKDLALAMADGAKEPRAVEQPPLPTPTATIPAPAPSMPPTTAAPTATAPPVSAEAYDNPAVKLLSWMCRVLALLVMAAELAGTIGLLMSFRTTAPKSKSTIIAKKNVLSATDEMERVLAQTGTGMWTKVAILVAGAIGVVALLVVAEMIEVVVSMQQSTVRMEQKMDYLTRSR